jgi:hypothetical protein
MIKLPLPPAACRPCGSNDERFRESYLAAEPGYYLSGDAGYMDDDGYLFVMSRIDDIINVAGHRLSTGGMEEVLAAHPDVAECAVIGVADQLKGELPLGLVVLKAGVERGIGEAEIGQGAGQAGARADRPGGGLQDRAGGGPAAQDPLRQDPARHHEAHRRRHRVPHAGHHRRPGHPGGDPAHEKGVLRLNDAPGEAGGIQFGRAVKYHIGEKAAKNRAVYL